MGPSESCPITDTKLKRIAWLSAREPNKVFHQLMHPFNEASLKGCFHELDGRTAGGADGITSAPRSAHLLAAESAALEAMTRRTEYRVLGTYQ
jgi:RNA-directed DNA polymerase